MDADSMKTLVRRYYDELWGQGRLGFIDEAIAEPYENCDPATPGNVVRGREGLRALVGGYRESFPDIRFEIVEQFVDGNVVTSRWRVSGTHRGALMGIPPSGRRVENLEGITLSTFEGSKILRDRVVWDTLGLLRQLGAVPG